MAGDDDRPRIAAKRLADRLRCAGLADPGRNLSVCERLAGRDRQRHFIDPTVEFGDAIHGQDNVIQPFVTIGANTVLWSGNHIGHDSTVGDNVFITSHVVVSGNCRIGDNVFIGVNATLRDGITVGRDCVVGAGTVLLQDAEPGLVFRATSTAATPIPSDALRRI